MGLLKHIEQLKEAYKKAYAGMKDEQRRHKQEELKFNAEKAKYNAKTIKDEADRISTEHRTNMNAIAKEVKETVARVRAVYEEEAKAEYQPKGDALIAEDVALFNSGILLSKEEVARMARKYADNSTMMRVLENYVTTNKIGVGAEVSGAFLKAERMNENAMRAFDVFEIKARRTLELMTYNEPNNEIFTRCNEKIVQYVKEYKNEMQIINTGSEGEGNV